MEKKSISKNDSKLIKDTEKVNEFIHVLEHPLKAELEAVRNIIKQANNKIAERIKWNAPSYYYKEDMAAFNLRDKKHVMLVFVFHNGAMIEDNTGLLEGDYKDRRLARFYNMEDVVSKKAALEKVVNEWVNLMEA